MSASILPPPMSAEQITLAWLASPGGKSYLAAYIASVYAAHNRQYVVVRTNGKRLPSVTAQSVGPSSVIEILL